MFYATLGVLSALLFIAGDIPYIRDTFIGKTKPHRVTWGLAALANCIAFANQWASGARNSLWLFGAGAVITGIIFLLSLKNGVGGYAKLDIFCLAISLVGIALWAIYDAPILSILATVVADVAMLVPTFVKTRKHPETETRISWLVGAMSVLLSAISVGKLNFQLLIIPLVSFILNAYMVYILYIEAPRRHTRQA